MTEKALVKKDNIFRLMATKYHLSEEDFKNTVKATLMPRDKNGKLPSDEQIVAFLIVAHQYNLNPFTNEIFAYPDKSGGITPVVGIDGFSAITNNHPQYDGMEIFFADEEVTLEGAKQCPKWCEVKIYKKNTSKPTVVREYLDEVYVAPRSGFSGPWQSHTKRMLRHKAIIQADRIAFGITGIYDEDEARRIEEANIVERELVTLKPEVEIPGALEHKEEIPTVKEENLYKSMLDVFGKLKEKVGEALYYKILQEHGYKHANEIRKLVDGQKVYKAIQEEYEREMSKSGQE